MKPPCLLALLAPLAIILAACSGPAPDAKVPQGPKKLKIALLTPGPVSDSGWSAIAYDGLQACQRELGAEIANQEANGTEKIRDAMRAFAQKDFDLVFGHGYEYNEPAVQVGKDFPKTAFVSSSGGLTAPNVGAFRFALEQGFYLAGAMAASLSKGGHVAMIGGPDVPSIRSTFKAFRAGALSVNPKIDVIETFTGKDSDIAAAKLATLAAIGRGADAVIHQANAGAQGVFDACKEKGAIAFGANANQNDNPSGVVVASAVIVARPAFVDLARQVQSGTFKGGVVTRGMDIGAIDFILNPKTLAKVPPPVAQKIEQMRAAIRDGKLAVPMDKF